VAAAGRFAFLLPPRDQKAAHLRIRTGQRAKLALMEERPLRKPGRGPISRRTTKLWSSRGNRNLYMMDAANYAKAQKDANDKTIVETQITTGRRGGFRLRAVAARAAAISSSNSSRKRIIRTSRGRRIVNLRQGGECVVGRRDSKKIRDGTARSAQDSENCG